MKLVNVSREIDPREEAFPCCPICDNAIDHYEAAVLPAARLHPETVPLDKELFRFHLARQNGKSNTHNIAPASRR